MITILPNINKGDFVWLDPTVLGGHLNDSKQFNISHSTEFTAIAARVLSIWTDKQGGEHIILLDDQSNKLELGATEFQRWAIRPMHPTSIQGVSDLIQMVELHEAALLRNFQIRHRQNIYHTFIGNRILVSLNSLSEEDILSVQDENKRKELIRSYRQKPSHELLPNIYAFGVEILSFIKNGKNNCCVIFSGETASGKSEYFKQLLSFLSSDFSNQNFEKKLNSSQIIIEAFANAKTFKNNNASRHGKYLELNYIFNNEISQIIIKSAHLELFFLEKYRVIEAFVEQSGESNFHIFYCLLSGLNPQQKLDFELTNGRISNYRILAQYRRNYQKNSFPSSSSSSNNNNNYLINGEPSWMFGGERIRPSFELLSKIVEAFKILNFSESEIEDIWRLLAVILHLGNLRYTVKNYDGKEHLELNDRLNIQRICKLLKVEKNILNSSLTIKSLNNLKSEEINLRKLTIDEAIDRRDTLCTEIYLNLVNYLIKRINKELFNENKNISNWKNSQHQKFVSVGLVDFQGLENKIKNGNNFEQLCINYGAECLQQFFIRRIFTLEQAEYAAQCLPEWEDRYSTLPYFDNLQILEMIAVQPLSIMSVIDDISIIPQAIDSNLLEKLHSSQLNNESFYQRPKSSLITQFAVRHYTGLVVHYKVEGMILKNKDKFPINLQKLINESELKFLQKIFQNNELNNDELCEDELKFKSIKRIKQNTQCTIVRQSINELMRHLESCPEAFFVRCLKTNDSKKEKLFETETVLRQIRQFDMISTVAMCRNCFPIHMEYINFVRRYKPLMPGIPSPNYCDCTKTTIFICQTIFGDSCREFVQFGKNKTFLKSEQHQFLEMLRSRRLHCCAALVKKCLLGWTKKQQYARLRWATLIFQKHWRGLIERKKFKIIIKGFTRLQALIRSHQLVIRYKWLISIIAHFQANCRASLLRYQLNCLVTRAERHCAMMARLDYQLESEGEPPALELHKNEFDNIINEKNFGSIKILNYSNEYNIKKENKINNNNNSFRWAKYALANFQQIKNTPKHTRILLERSLLSHKKPLDELVAMSIWRRLLQLIGDNNASDYAAFEGNNNNNDSLPIIIMSKLKSLYSQDYSDDEINFIRAHLLNYQTYQDNSFILKKSIKIAKNILLGEANWSAFEKIKFIISVGIFRQTLRDEIYSQICKQIYLNPSFQSSLRGWILLALCSSSFAPTFKLIPYLINFINTNSPNILLQNYISKQINKTIKFGSRREPCLKAEFAYVCSINNLNNNSKLFIQINLPNEQIIDIPINSQITISNVFQLLIEKINLKEFFGFGLFLFSGKDIRSLVIGEERLLDALGLVEEQNNFNWKLYLRKELFLPLENDSDELAIELSYQQIIKGIKFGEYKCYKEEDLALLAAQQYFILNNKKSIEIDICELEDNLKEYYLPLNNTKDENINLAKNEEIEKEECQKWVQLILHSYRKKILNNGELPLPNIIQIKYSIIKFASLQWPLHFSRFFEVYKFSGPPLPVNQLTMAINLQGIFLLDAHFNINNNEKQILFKIEFIELLNINYGKSKHEGADAIFINLLNGDRYTFQSSLAKELSNLLINILQNLHKHSIYAIAIKDYNHCTVQHKMKSSNNSVLNLLKGDLLILSSPLYKELNNNEKEEEELNFIENVENVRSKIKGKVPFNFIHILACKNKPSKELLNTIFLNKKIIEQKDNNTTEYNNNKQNNNNNNDIYEYPSFYTTTIDPFGIPLICGPFPQPHTLEHFASTKFRLPENGNNKSFDVFGAYTVSGKAEPDLWRHSFEPIKGPLLKRIVELENEIIIKESLISYTFILKYMGDYLSNPQQFYLEHTDYIFTPPLKYEILRDETYCQLMKQLTDNPNPLSEERGWELIWLCIGLFPPSKFLCREVEHFLRTRIVPMAADCSIRLQKALSQCNEINQYCRLSPPHQVELEAIKYKQTQIFHKFYLPDGTQETIEVESWTCTKDFSKKIATRLGLLNLLKGFGLFIKLGEKVVCMPDQEYFFDFINQIQDWARKNFRRENILNNGRRLFNSGINFNYQVHFMRKLWLDVEPGKDIRQDIIFNYPQELPKYLRGYHQIDKNEAIQFASLILRAQIKDDKQISIQNLQHILHELLPIDLLKFHSPNEWKKLISDELQKEGMPKNSTEAKLCFLSKIAKEPTFGSAFFEVKQSADPTLCSKLLVAINRDGMSLYELESKKYIRTHGFKQLSNWQSANTYFHLTLDNGNRLLFETTLGHKLDDLLTSYIQALISKQEKENGKQKISPLSKIAVLLHQYKPITNNNIGSSPPLTLINGN